MSASRYFHRSQSISDPAQDLIDREPQSGEIEEIDEHVVNTVDLSKYKRYTRIDKTTSSKPHVNKRLENNQLKSANAVTRAAILDDFNTHNGFGSIEVEDDETTMAITQSHILAQSSLATQNKYFDLMLPENGPYIATYSPGGKQMLLAGQMGHVANFNWRAKQLSSEINVAERVRDCCWLQNDTMYAVAQKRYTHVYDKKGVELHCLKRMDFMEHIDFMPYHFLLFGINDLNYLSYFDVSIGKLVSSNKAYSCKTLTMAQNKSTAVTYLGHTNGVLTLWSPNSDKFLASMLCHKAALSAMCISNDGLTMVTAGKDKQLCMWDTRTLKCFQKIQMRDMIEPVSTLAFSQTGLLACSSKSSVRLLKPNAAKGGKYFDYLQHTSPATIKSLEFCPFEDVLAIGHHVGLQSIIIPGSSNANYDSKEANPMANKKQRRNQEVNRMIEKVNYEMIDPEVGAIGKVNVTSLRDKIIERNEVGHLKKKTIQVGKMKNKSRGKGKDQARQSRKKAIFDQRLTEKIKSSELKKSSNVMRKNDVSSESESAIKKKKKDPLSIFE